MRSGDHIHVDAGVFVPKAQLQPERALDDTPPTVILSGDLDVYGAADVRAVLDLLAGPGIIDMRAVRYLDASVLGELVRAAKRVGPGRITLIVGSANVRKVLDIVHFERLFTIRAGTDEATTA